MIEKRELAAEILAYQQSGTISGRLTELLNEMFLGIARKFASKQPAEDVIQDCWLKFVERWGKAIDCNSPNVFSYMTTCCINQIRLRHRNTKKHDAVPLVGIEKEIDPVDHRGIELAPYQHPPEPPTRDEIKRMAEQAGINSETVRGRLRMGWELQRALTTPVRKSKLYSLGGELKTIKQWAAEKQIPESTLRNWVNYGPPHSDLSAWHQSGWNAVISMGKQTWP